jgi:hypothetical protein
MSVAMDLLEANPDNINWVYLSSNPAAIHLLKENLDKISWDKLSENPGIFEYDYEAMKRPFTEELVATVYHPDNYKRLIA